MYQIGNYRHFMLHIMYMHNNIMLLIYCLSKANFEGNLRGCRNVPERVEYVRPKSDLGSPLKGRDQ
jgi:hypothetical protein